MKCDCLSAPQYHRDDCPDFDPYGQPKALLSTPNPKSSLSYRVVFILKHWQNVFNNSETIATLKAFRHKDQEKITNFKSLFWSRCNTKKIPEEYIRQAWECVEDYAPKIKNNGQKNKG